MLGFQLKKNHSWQVRFRPVPALSENIRIFGNGTNYGLHRIAAISDRSVGVLRGVNDAFVRPETISAANDLISNGIASLPVFKHYTINESAPFGSIDGQKYACRINQGLRTRIIIRI